jgi:hypothetical protein
MNYFLLILVATAIYYGIRLFQRPNNWLLYLHSLPIIIFMSYARYYDMSEQAWVGAFELAAVTAIGVIFILWQQNILFDRIMLGLNIFLIIGAIGFLFNNETILQWYSTSHGGPLFMCIVLVGIVSMIFTKAGFIGVQHKNKDAVRYASFLLLVATFIALVWSVSADADGLFWAVALPLVILSIVRHLLSEHLF